MEAVQKFFPESPPTAASFAELSRSLSRFTLTLDNGFAHKQHYSERTHQKFHTFRWPFEALLPAKKSTLEPCVANSLYQREAKAVRTTLISRKTPT